MPFLIIFLTPGPCISNLAYGFHCLRIRFSSKIRFDHCLGLMFVPTIVHLFHNLYTIYPLNGPFHAVYIWPLDCKMFFLLLSIFSLILYNDSNVSFYISYACLELIDNLLNHVMFHQISLQFLGLYATLGFLCCACNP